MPSYQQCAGNPVAGVSHARKHVVMVNVEGDVLSGPLFDEEAEAAGVVYTMAWGDQPALASELVEWARTCGFDVVAAGETLKWSDVAVEREPEALRIRQEMETRYRPLLGVD